MSGSYPGDYAGGKKCKMQFIGEKKLQSNIKTIAKTGAKLSALIHLTAVQALVWASSLDKDGNVRNDARPMDQLLNALPKGTRVEGFKAWVYMFSPIRWNGDEKVGVLKETAKTYKPYDIEGADACPFWEATKENEVKSLSPEALMALIKRETDKILSADAEGVVRDKSGQPRFNLEGNVVEMKDYAQKVNAALSAIIVPAKVVKSETVKDKTLLLKADIPGAVSTALANQPTAPVQVTKTDVTSEPVSQSAAA